MKTQNSTARIELRVRPAEKERLAQLARRCNLSLTEYMVQRSLGYEPHSAPPQVIYDLYGKLCALCNGTVPPEDKAELITLTDAFYNEFLANGKKVSLSQQQASGR